MAHIKWGFLLDHLLVVDICSLSHKRLVGVSGCLCRVVVTVSHSTRIGDAALRPPSGKLVGGVKPC